MKYQYHVYNEHFSLIVTVNIKSPEYATGLGIQSAINFYGYDDKYTENVICDYITSFLHDSIVNVNMLKKV